MRRLAPLLAALSLAGCGGASTAPDLSGVARAAEKTEAAGTARFTMTFDVSGLTGAKDSAAFGAEGEVDYERGRTRMKLDLGDLADLFGQNGAQGEATSIEMILDGTTLFMRFPLLNALAGGKPWVKLDLDKLSETAGGDLDQVLQVTQSDPSQALTYLRAAGDFAEVGAEQVQGVETTHYEGTIDLRKAAEQFSGAERDRLDELLKDADRSEIPAEAWVDGQGYLRKLTLSFAGLSGSTGDGGFSMGLVLHDFGSAVDVELPAAKDVADITDLAAKGAGS